MEVKSIAYFSKAAYKGNGSTVQYSAPFPYISPSHVVVTVDNAVAPFTWLNTGTVRLATAPASGKSVVVKRVTPRNIRLVDFTDGSFLTERELDLSALQLLYILQEIIDDVADTIHYDFSSDKYDAGGRPITNVGDPLNDADVVTLRYYKTVVLPALLAEAEKLTNSILGPISEALDSTLADIREEVENYRLLVEDYRKNLDDILIKMKEAEQRVERAASEVEIKTNEAVAEIRSLADGAVLQVEAKTNAAVTEIGNLTDNARLKYEAYLKDLTEKTKLLTQQAEAIRLIAAEAKTMHGEVEFLVASIKDFRYKGAWRNGTIYQPQNVVYHGGSSFVLVEGDGTNEPTGDTPPGEGWQFLAKRGENYYSRIIDGGEPDTEFTVFIDGGTPDEF